MHIAQSKRKENIAEYILHLWQIEDLIRALQFSPEAIYTKLVEPMAIDAVAKQDELLWYTSIANLLREEGKESQGHLEHTMHLIAELQQLHLELLNSSQGEEYRVVYAKVAPELPRLKTLLSSGDVSDIEICFRALYAAMLYRIKGDDKAASDVVELISPLIAHLADASRRIESGELVLGEEED